MSTKNKNTASRKTLISSFSDDDYFDDCPVCQALKKAEKEGREPTLTELKEATLEAQKKGAVAGGSLLDEGLN